MSATAAGVPSSHALSRAFLCSNRIIGATSDYSRRHADTTSQHAEFGSQSAEESNTFVDANFGGIVPKLPLLFDHATIDIVGAANTPASSQNGHFGTKKELGTLIFSVGTGFDGDGCTWAAAS